MITFVLVLCRFYKDVLHFVDEATIVYKGRIKPKTNPIGGNSFWGLGEISVTRNKDHFSNNSAEADLNLIATYQVATWSKDPA